MKLLLLLASCFSLSFPGCADFNTPTAGEVLRRPFGTGAPFTRGTTRAEVMESWGPPHRVIPHGLDELGNPREEWIYEGAIQALPIDHEYMSRTKRLFFEGDNLVNWKTDDPAK